MEVKPLIAELRERMIEELDYRDEADNQRAFAAAFDGDEQVRVPTRGGVARRRRWSASGSTGRRCRTSSAPATRHERDHAGRAARRVPLSPRRPGSGCCTPTRIRATSSCWPTAGCSVVDFGAVARLPDGLPRTLGDDDPARPGGRSSADLLALLRGEGFVARHRRSTAEDALAYLAPFIDPLRSETFRFTRKWLRGQAERVGDLRGPDFRTGRALNLPPQYLLIHRVTLGSLGVLCQLGAEVGLRDIVRRWQPGIVEDESKPGFAVCW